MTARFRRKQPTERPRTLTALFIRAGVLREKETRAGLRERLRSTGWHDADAVARAAFEIAVRQAYTPPNNAKSVSEMVVGMREFFGADGVDRIPQAEGELLIRSALDDSVSIAEVPVGVAFAIHGLIFAGLALDLRYTESDLDAVLLRAEAVAMERGASPTLASDG